MKRLCLILRCTPNDLLEWIPGDNNTIDETHPINMICKNDKIVSITKTLNSVPIAKLDEIERLINQQNNNGT